MNAYTRFCATEVIGIEGVAKLEDKGLIVADRAEIDAMNLRIRRLNTMIDDIIDAKQKDIEVFARNIRGIEAARTQVMKGAAK